MTDDEINRAVALELGWNPYDQEPCYWLKPHEDRSVFVLPNFATSHNAAAEMRNRLRPCEREEFAVEVWGAVETGKESGGGQRYWAVINSTPRQQAEAFLRMRGKWVEGTI